MEDKVNKEIDLNVDLVDLIKLCIRDEVSYLDKRVEDIESMLTALSESLGKRIDYQAKFGVKDLPKDGE